MKMLALIFFVSMVHMDVSAKHVDEKQKTVQEEEVEEDDDVSDEGMHNLFLLNP